MDVALTEAAEADTEELVDVRSQEVTASTAGLVLRTGITGMTTGKITILLPPRANDPGLIVSRRPPVLVAGRKGLPTPSAGRRDPLTRVAGRGNLLAPASWLDPINRQCLPNLTPRIVPPDLNRSRTPISQLLPIRLTPRALRIQWQPIRPKAPRPLIARRTRGSESQTKKTTPYPKDPR